MREKIGFITDIDFWKAGAGPRVRARSLILYLTKHVDLVVFYSGKAKPSDAALIKRLNLPITYYQLNEIRNAHQHNPQTGLADELAKIFSQHNLQQCILRGWENRNLAEVLPDNIYTYFDIDDFRSEVFASAQSSGTGPLADDPITFEEELQVYKQYDKLLVIQQEHLRKAKTLINEKKLLYVPHAMRATRTQFRQSASTIGLLASGWAANRDGIAWFANKVMPHIQSPNIRFLIFGYISTFIQQINDPRIKVMGNVQIPFDAYNQIDIGINPVSWGSGIKIKTLELLAHGIPTVVTSEGGRGLSHLFGGVLLKTDDPIAFAQHIDELIRNYELRLSMSKRAKEYIQLNYSEESCYQRLINEIKTDRENNAA
ncbi:hypothetical protein TDB9533_02868 [Thalassocella blandensis]|nr:hypothetical protein TDB9533_02868 [Thalassocella blandensis]